MSSLSSTRGRRHHRRNTDRAFLFFTAGAFLVVIGILVVVNYLANSRAAAPTAGVPQEADLLPLADPVNPILGFHDMENLPDKHAAPARTLAADAPQPNVDLPLMIWDWGTIPAVPPVEQVFPIQNTGQEPLEIRNVVTSCGCTTAELSSSLIPPGQRADLRVVFDPNFHATSGPVTRLIWLETNDPDQPLIELRLDANVAP